MCMERSSANRLTLAEAAGAGILLSVVQSASQRSCLYAAAALRAACKDCQENRDMVYDNRGIQVRVKDSGYRVWALGFGVGQLQGHDLVIR